MSAAELSAIFDRLVATELATEGFEKQKPRRWIRTTKSPVQEFIMLLPLKGATEVVAWGFGLLFSPRLAGGTLRWKRTSASADVDLVFDPVDIKPDWRENYAFVSQPLPSPIDLAKTVRNGALAARETFANVETAKDLWRVFAQRASMPSDRFGPKNYVQFDLGYGLALLASGNTSQGREHITRFCERFEIAPSDRVLLEAISQAEAIGATQ